MSINLNTTNLSDSTKKPNVPDSENQSIKLSNSFIKEEDNRYQSSLCNSTTPVPNNNKIKIEQNLKKKEKTEPFYKTRSKSAYNLGKCKFPKHFDCSKYCQVHPCKVHHCLKCKEKVGSMNALVCNSCLRAQHLACMNLPKMDLFEKSWYCDSCFENLSETMKDKINRFFVKGYNIGKGNVLVGSSYKLRMQLSHNNLHRPGMAGIHGSEASPAYSIVMNGGYEGDEDNGFEFYYTGAGGLDLNTGKQIGHQSLTSSNLSLAGTCDAEINPEGAEAMNWKKSSPIRVIRGSNLYKKNPRFAPQVGYRYDGIYRLVKYWKEKLKNSPYIVYRYHFKRDDEEPAPWTDEGRKYIKDNNITYVNYEKVMRNRDPKEQFNRSIVGKKKTLKVRNDVIDNVNEVCLTFPVYQRKSMAIVIDSDIQEAPECNPTQHCFEIFTALIPFIDDDKLNEKKWRSIKEFKYKDLNNFIGTVCANFACNLCGYLVDYKAPVTTPCGHTFCYTCIQNYLLSNHLDCPKCNFRLITSGFIKNEQINSNEFPKKDDVDKALYLNNSLMIILKAIMPFFALTFEEDQSCLTNR